MRKYVVGFLFNETGDEVALVRRNHPPSQDGKLNGVGGHVEDGETFDEAMRREALEEWGKPFGEVGWEHYEIVGGDDWQMYVYRAFDNIVYDVPSKDDTDQRINIYPADNTLEHYGIMANMRWLIPKARYYDGSRVPQT